MRGHRHQRAPTRTRFFAFASVAFVAGVVVSTSAACDDGNDDKACTDRGGTCRSHGGCTGKGAPYCNLEPPSGWCGLDMRDIGVGCAAGSCCAPRDDGSTPCSDRGGACRASAGPSDPCGTADPKSPGPLGFSCKGDDVCCEPRVPQATDASAD